MDFVKEYMAAHFCCFRAIHSTHNRLKVTVLFPLLHRKTFY